MMDVNDDGNNKSHKTFSLSIENASHNTNYTTTTTYTFHNLHVRNGDHVDYFPYHQQDHGPASSSLGR